MQADGESFASLDGDPVVAKAVGEFKPQDFRVKLDSPIHV
jgi:hypothetical protein